MSTENKVVDINIETNTPFGWLMQFDDVTTDSLGNITETFVNLTGCTFKGAIKKDLDSSSPILTSFSINIIDVARGVVSVSLTKAQTASLAAQASTSRDKYNPRLRFLGYYDIILVKTSTQTEIRILEGKVFISDGVTV